MLTNRPSQNRPSSQKYCRYSLIGLATLFGTIGSLANIQYAATFPYTKETAQTHPSEVNFTWLQNLSANAITGVVFNGIATLIISGVYGSQCIYIAMLRFYEELLLFKKGQNTSRFPTEILMALLSGITGGSIAGTPFTDIVQWIARFLGFIIVFSLSFLGSSELFIKMTDKDHTFKMQVISYLKRLDPLYQADLNLLLRGKELNDETVNEFLNQVFTFAHANKDKQIFREESRKEVGFSTADYVISGLLTLNCSLMYIQSGFSGLNILANNYLNNIPNYAQIILGFPAGLQLALFVFFSSRFFLGGFAQHIPNISNDVYGIPKLILLLGLTAGNSSWYYGLAMVIARAQNIFSAILSTPFGITVFPAIAYIAIFILGINGLASILFPPKINVQNPSVNDVIKGLEYNVVSKESLRGLKQNSFFSNTPMPVTLPLN